MPVQYCRRVRRIRLRVAALQRGEGGGSARPAGLTGWPGWITAATRCTARRVTGSGSGDLVLLADQDRSRWDRELITEGQALVR
ncbi:DUF6596 domain-containing protein [Streptomyces sp. NPDC002187]|uniref:DUF6596 domain-containing protein n=1 Tax=Streptomyces sp. NPDC002187 TaxID=3364637 RepID=UPI003682F3B1